MATSTPGVGSGLDVNSIVNQLVAMEKQPLQKLQQRASTIQTQVSSWGKLKSLMDTLNTAAKALSLGSTWSQTTVASADATAVGAATATTGTAAAGRYSVTVNQLAQESSLASGSVAAGTDLRGRLTLELGQYDAATPPGFTAQSGSTALTLDFTDPATTLTDVRNAINAANAGIRATVINDGAGQRLIVSSAQTGADQALRIVSSDPQSTGANGLSAFAYDGSGSSTMTATRQARDASFSINGVSLTSRSNVLDGTVSGLRLQLLKASATPIDITVDNDVASQRKLVEDFVSAYNAVNNQVAADTSYDAASRKGGVFQGDSSALSVRRQLRDVLGVSSTASATYSRLSDLGLDIRRDGTIAINATRLTNALAQPEAVGKLMSAAGSGTEESKGLGLRLTTTLNQLLDADGLVDSKATALRSRLKQNQTDQDRLNDRIEATRQRLLRQYQSLDSRVAQLNGLGGYVNQQFGNR